MGTAQLKITQQQYDDIAAKADIMQKFRYFAATGYEPHPKQADFHRSSAKMRVLVAGRRSGKSVAAQKEAEFAVLKPGMLIWCCAPTYKLADVVFSKIYHQLIVKGVIPLNGIIRKSENDHMIRIGFDKDGIPTNDLSRVVETSEIWGKSTDNPDSLLGHSLDLLIYDECAKDSVKIWDKYLSPTLTDRDGKAIFITTPEGQNWVYKMHLRGKDPERKNWESFSFTTGDNPHISREYLEEQKLNLPEEVFEQEHLALFTAFRGQVYKGLDREVHGIDACDIPSIVSVRLGIDFGFTNPTAILEIGTDHDGRMYILDEHYETRMHESDIVEVVDAIRRKHGILYDGGIADSSEPDKIAALSAYGINSVYKGDNSIRNGIVAVASLLKVQPDGKPRLYIGNHCRHCWEELPNYKYSDKKNTNIKEEPQKVNDHTADALRYLVYTDKYLFTESSCSGSGIEI